MFSYNIWAPVDFLAFIKCFYYLTSFISFHSTDWLQHDIVFLVGMRWYIGCWRLNHDYERSYPLNSLERNFWSDCFLQLRKVKSWTVWNLKCQCFTWTLIFEYNCGAFVQKVEDSCFAERMLFVSCGVSILFGSDSITIEGVHKFHGHFGITSRLV